MGFRLERIVAVVDMHSIYFLDLETRKKIKDHQLRKIDGGVSCFQSNISGFVKGQSKELYLFVGKSLVSYVEKIQLPRKLSNLRKRYTQIISSTQQKQKVSRKGRKRKKI